MEATRGVIKATEIECEMSREKLIQHIEQNELESDVRLLVEETWNSIEAACKVERKRRYE